MTRTKRAHSPLATFREAKRGRLRQIRLGRDLVVDSSQIVARISDSPPPIASDLLTIASAIYAVDRLAKRPNGRAVEQFGDWSRDLSVTIGVSNPDAWNEQVESFARLLRWLTDDNWELAFIDRASERADDYIQTPLIDSVPLSRRPLLFSGGLDSACGMYHNLLESDVLSVSVYTNSWMQQTQRVVREAMDGIAGHRIFPLSYRIFLPAETKESSQRTRGLLFLSAGATAAWAVGADGLIVAENGIGAINLPYIRSQHGAQATRAMHPQTIRMVSDIVSAAMGRKFTIETPYLSMTKAELVKATDEAPTPALSRTVSCDSGFSARVKDRLACGSCTSCLLRQQSIFSANRTDIGPVQHRVDSMPDTPAFGAMAWQAHRLRRSLSRQSSWSELVVEFPELLYTNGLVSEGDLTRLYAQYVAEFEQFCFALGVGEVWK